VETNLRKLLIDEQLPLKPEPEREGGRLTRTVEVVVFDAEPGQVILTISEDGDSILEVSQAKRFFPPLVTYSGMAEQAVQERIQALFEAAATRGGSLPKVASESLLSFFQDQLGDDEPLRVLVGNEELAAGLEGPDVFLGAGPPFAIGIRGQPGAIVTTPVGVGMFIRDVAAVAGVLVAA